MAANVTSQSTSKTVASKRRPFHQVLAAISMVFSAFPRSIRRAKVTLPLGLVWRISAILWVLIQHAERTGGDAETLRQARALYAVLQRLQGRTSTVRSQPISSDITPVA